MKKKHNEKLAQRGYSSSCYKPGLSLNKKQALWLVDSWSCALDQIKMYPDRDTLMHLLPIRQIQQYVLAMWLFKGKSKYTTKHLMYGPLETS